MTSTATGPADLIERVEARIPGLVERGGWSRDELLAYQRERLNDLIRHAVAASPYYRETLGADAAHGDVELSDLPTLPKASLMENFDRIATEPALRLADIETHLAGPGASVPFADRYRVFSTSGTTGVRGVFVMDRGEWEKWIAVHFRLFRNMGLAPGMRMAPIGAPSEHHLSRQLFAAFRAAPEAAPYLSVTTPLDDIVDALNQYQPDALVGYPSMHGALAEEQLQGRLQIAPKVVAAGAEPVTEDVRRRIDAAWGIRPAAIYATTEVPVIAAASSDSPTLELVEDYAIVEPVDELNRPVGPGEPSAKVLVTNLVNYAQPLIRYELSDAVTPAGGPNPAGRPWARLTRVEGRAADMIELPARDGGTVRLHPVRVGEPFAAVPDVRQFRVLHDESGIVVRLVLREAAAADTTQRVRSALLAELEASGALPPPLRVEAVAELRREPGPAGKFRVVKSAVAARRRLG
jgi:phenylacetate-CoA ligase